MLLRTFRLSLVAFFAFPLMVSAQSFNNTDPLTVSVNPKYPIPFSQAVLTPSSNSVKLSNSVITITANGTQIYKGNAKPVSVPLGAAGSLVSVVVTLTSDGKAYSKTILLRPQDVSIIAEPVSSAPPLYPGKPLVPLEGSTRIVAIANVKGVNGKVIDPSTLSYSWTVDDTRIASASGIGKDTLLVASPRQYRNRDVSVVVQSQDGSVSGGESLVLAPKEPTVRLYENDPLLGIRYDREISGTYNVVSSEKTLHAAPYSFSITDTAPALQWFLNGVAAQTGSSITLRPTGSGSGSAALSLVATGKGSIRTTNKLSLSFGEDKGGFGIFGL